MSGFEQPVNKRLLSSPSPLFLLTHEYSDACGIVLRVEMASDIIEGRDLPSMDVGGTSDPYCDIYTIDASSKRCSERWKTKVINKTLQPIFNERFAFGVDSDLSETHYLMIDVYDSDPLRQDDHMGTVKIDLQEVEKSPLKVMRVDCLPLPLTVRPQLLDSKRMSFTFVRCQTQA